MELRQAIFGRRSVREYEARPVDEALIRSLIASAIVAPNAVNEQPWTFTVVRDAAVLDRVSREAKAHVLATLKPGSDAERFLPMLQDLELPHSRPRARAHPDLGARARAVDHGGLCAGGGEF